jgi:hypothetical protein
MREAAYSASCLWAGAVGQEAFERLWGTPQNVDLEGAALNTSEQLISCVVPALGAAGGSDKH